MGLGVASGGDHVSRPPWPSGADPSAGRVVQRAQRGVAGTAGRRRPPSTCHPRRAARHRLAGLDHRQADGAAEREPVRRRPGRRRPPGRRGARPRRGTAAAPGRTAAPGRAAGPVGRRLARASASRPTNPPGLSRSAPAARPTSTGESVLSMSWPQSRYAFSRRRLPQRAQPGAAQAVAAPPATTARARAPPARPARAARSRARRRT